MQITNTLATMDMKDSYKPILKKIEIEMELPQEVRYIINRLERHDYEAYVVGGCVRDTICNQLLGTDYAINDYDITTDATPDEIMNIFSTHKIIRTGLKHGTVTLHLENSNYEITTYRVDSDYSDHRHPSTVKFVRNIYEDLSRRDLTINAIAYNPHTGFVDPFNGIIDIYNRIIKCVGNPNERLQEDALRILRTLRFASNKGFKIESETLKAITDIENCKLLRYVSRERITDEFRKMINISKNLIDTEEKREELIQKIIYEYHPIIDQILPSFLDMCNYNVLNVNNENKKI